MANNLDSGFLILYEWLPMLEGLGYREFKNVIMTLIQMQRDCAEIGAVTAQYRRSIGALSTQKARTTASIISAVIERRVLGKASKINGKTETEEQRTTSPTPSATTSPTPSAKRREDNNYIYNTYIPSFQDISSAPTREEVAAYAATKEGRKTDPDEFFNYFQVRAWRLPDGSPVRDWRAMFDVWEANHDKRKAKESKAPCSFDVDEMFANALARSARSCERGESDADTCD